MRFPEGFVWGAAASAYQIEGAASEGGRGPSVWDTFSRKAGAVWEGQNGDVACEHYHRFRDDVRIMKELGLRAYRLSISWTRVLPDGIGAVNAQGLGFYDALIDELLGAGIRPFVTLFHWDYPQALFDRGGWLDRNSPEWFAEYTGVVADRLSDRVRDWMTLNEPQCFLRFGHAEGTNAPGLKLSLREQLLACHHALLAHGRGVQVIRARAKAKPSVGWAPVAVVKYPASESPADVAAARELMMSVRKPDLWNNTWYNDPIFFGRYPEDGLKLYGEDAPVVAAGDMDVIQQPMDFLGVNIYEGQPVRAGADGQAVECPRPVGHALTAFRWPVEPESLCWGPRLLYERYKTPIYITENGLSNIDWIALDGAVHDPQRIDFTHRYLRALGRAVEAGADVRGYFHWSVFDNFEWAQGYKERFGLVFVDFPTQWRVLKDSARWYRGVIESNGEGL
jgi:beta-glucosidase